MKVSEVMNQLTQQQGTEKSVCGIAAVIIENIAVSNFEQNVPCSELNCLMREFRSHYENLKSPNNLKWKALKASVERGERYANEFTESIINLF